MRVTFIPAEILITERIQFLIADRTFAAVVTGSDHQSL
jgi:hypothetical protein